MGVKSLRLRLLAGCALAAAAAGTVAAQCTPNPTQGSTTTTCSGTETQGLLVNSTSPTVTVNSGATVQAPAGTSAITVTSGPTTQYGSSPTISILGAVNGGTAAGILVGPSTSEPATFNLLIPNISVAAGGSVSGAQGISLVQNPAAANVLTNVTLSNAGMITGGVVSSGANTQFASITNQSGGEIDSINASVQTLTNAAGGVIGGGATAITAPFLNLTNRGVIDGNVTTTNSADFSVIDTSGGGKINGAINLAGAGNTLITDFGSSAHPIAGVTGPITATGGNNTLVFNFSGNATLSAPPAAGTAFSNVGFQISNATVTLAASYSSSGEISMGSSVGGGTLVNNGTLTNNQGAVIASSIPNYFTYYGVSMINNGVVSATLSGSGYAINLGNYAAFTNTGQITAIGGGGVNASSLNPFTNSGTITADLTAANIFDGTFSNTGSIRSNQGVGVYFLGDVGLPASNSGQIWGAQAGAEISGYTLSNTGVITSPTLGVDLDPYGSMNNQAGGVINGGVGIATGGQYTFDSEVINAGVINGDVRFAYGSQSIGAGNNNVFIAAPGGVVTGNLYLATGDVFITSLANTGPGAFAGVDGTVSAPGDNTLEYLVTANANVTIAPPSGFTSLGYVLIGNPTLTLTAPSTLNSGLNFTGTGTVDLTANITTTNMAAINLLALDYYPSASATPAVNLTSHGAISVTDTGYGSGAVLLGTGETFTNAGTITAIGLQLYPNSYLTAILASSGATVVNSGTISLSGGIGVEGATTVTNTGTISQAQGGSESLGVIEVTTLTNSGTISVGGPAVALEAYNSLSPTLINSGTIASATGPAVSCAVLPCEVVLDNQAGGVITSQSGPAITLFPGSQVTNAGTINGDVQLSLPTYYSYYGPGTTYVSNNGQLNGNLTFSGSGNLFAAYGTGPGVTGVIDGGPGGTNNTYIQVVTATATIVAPQASSNVVDFQNFFVGAQGAATVATVTGPAAGVNAPLVYFGNGTIINQVNVISGGATPNIVQLVDASALTGVPAGLNFVNQANLPDGVEGTAASFTNTGVIGEAATPIPAAVVLQTPTSGAFSFVNSGTISTDVAGGAAFAILATSSGNSGPISVVNSGTIVGIGEILPDGGPVTIVNSGTITSSTWAIASSAPPGTPGSTSLTNQAAGVIIGEVDLATAQNTLVNLGQINGDVVLGGTGDSATDAGAINGSLTFQGAGAQLTLEHGWSITGPITLGGGATVLNLALAGSLVAPDAVNINALPSFATINQTSGVTLVSGDLTTGALNIEAGQFIGAAGYVINAPTINVAQGAVFGTAGTVVGSINVAGGLEPGDAPGTMTVIGSVRFAATSNAIFTITPTTYSALLTTGAVTVAPGAELTLTGTAPRPGTELTLIEAGGGVSGAFSVVDQFATGNAAISQTADSVTLTGLFGASAGLPGQATSAANYLNGLIETGAASSALRELLPAFANPDGSSDAPLLNQLTPEPYASAMQIGVEDGLTVAQAVREGLAGWSQASGPFAFGQDIGSWRQLRGDDGASSARLQSGGIVGGLGWGGTLGSAALILGALGDSQTIGALGSSTSDLSFIIGGSARLTRGSAAVNVTVAYDQGFADTYRSTLAGRAHGTFDLDDVVTDASARYDFKLASGWTATPEVGVTYIHVDRGVANESGAGALNLAVQSAKADVSYADGTITLAHTPSGAWRVSPWVDVGFRSRLSGLEVPIAWAAFTGEPGSFGAYGAERAQTLATAGAGVSLWLTGSSRVTAAYHGEFASGAGDNAVTLGLICAF